MTLRLKRLSAAWCDESGAVTSDWFLISAATIGVALSILASVQTGAVDLGNEVNMSLAATEVDGVE